jgi:hypothetical protein
MFNRADPGISSALPFGSAHLKLMRPSRLNVVLFP